MLFSVVIPAYNRESFLGDAIDSVFNQTFGDYELIVVDDGSTDGTAACAESRGSKVRLIRQQNSGPAVARNAGAAAANGEYLAFLDSDDVWLPWTLETMARIVEMHERPSFIAGSVSTFSSLEELSALHPEPTQALSYPDYFASSAMTHFTGSGSMVLRRDAFLLVGGFSNDTTNAEDHDLSLRLGVCRKFVKVLAPQTLAYREHGTNITKNTLKTAQGILLLIERERHGSYPGGSGRKANRRQIIGFHVRPAAISCVRGGLQCLGWALYRKTFLWHLRLRRLKFLLGFPILSLWTEFWTILGRARKPMIARHAGRQA